ncbi:MAG TPA: DUF222 domain-containing protein [Candidatus Dormibacteraeota bacterium]|nr:DUF222 domain-containing protein [Candidatus Dormibacteraeota bacterium]
MAQMWGGGACTPEPVDDEDISIVPLEVLGDEIQQLFKERNRIDARIERRLRRFDKEQGYFGDGALTTRAWLRWKCRISAAEASERLEVARRLADLEITDEALSEGTITFRHAALIARTARDLGDKWETNAEEIVVTAAKDLDPHRLGYVTDHLKHCVLPDGSLADANRNHDNRRLYLSQTMDGVFRIDGQLDAEGGAILKTALDALMPPPSIEDGLGAAPRRADALVELARRQLDGGGLPQKAGQKPHLLVSVEIATLAKAPGSPAAELEWAQTVPAETARRIACDCCITDVKGERHRTSRIVPGWMRRQLAIRDKGCRWPGCDIPAPWTDAHHLFHWANGGFTVLANLILLCRRHHRKVHEGGWQLVGSGDGLIQAVPP